MWKTLESNRLAHIVHFHSNNRAAQQQHRRDFSPIYDLFFFLVFPDTVNWDSRMCDIMLIFHFSLYRFHCKAWIKTTPKCLEMRPREISSVVDFYFRWQILLCHSISIMLIPWTLPRRACSEVHKKPKKLRKDRSVRREMKTSREKQNSLGRMKCCVCYFGYFWGRGKLSTFSKKKWEREEKVKTICYCHTKVSRVRRFHSLISHPLFSQKNRINCLVCVGDKF